MAQRVGIMNGKNLNQDKDFSALSDLLVSSSCILNGLSVTTNTVGAGRALIKCTRTSTTPNETVWCIFENTANVTIDTSGTKKVWVEILQTRINDASLNTDISGVGIGEIKTGASYPSSNYVPLASITSGVITNTVPDLTLNKMSVNGLFKLSKSSNIASAATTDLSTVTGNTVHITGTTTITSLGTLPAGTKISAIFDGVLNITHNATSLILPTSSNIITAAGDTAEFTSEGSGNWKCTSYLRNDGTAVSSTPPSVINTQKTLVAGENLTAGNAIYISSADGKAYKADGNTLAKREFVGFANETVSIGANLKVNTSGIDNHQTGLTIGSTYFLGTSGGITKTPQNSLESVGIAVSSTEILMRKTENKKFEYDIAFTSTAAPFVSSGVSLVNVGYPYGVNTGANGYIHVNALPNIGTGTFAQFSDTNFLQLKMRLARYPTVSNFYFTIGFVQTASDLQGGGSLSAPGVAFFYDLGNLKLLSRDGSTSSLTSSIFSLDTNVHDIEFTWDKANNLLTLIVDGNTVGTKTANLPTQTGKFVFGIGMQGANAAVYYDNCNIKMR